MTSLRLALPPLAILCLLLSCGDGRIQRREEPEPIPEPACGDAKVDEGEDCDGSDLGGESCTSLGFDLGTLSCNAECKFSTQSCVKLCGDGEIGPGEECDGQMGPLSCGDWGYKSCTSECKVSALHCRSESFVAGAPVNFTSGGRSILTDLAPAGYGDLVTAIPDFFRLKTHRFDTTQGFKEDRTLSRMNDGAMPFDVAAGDLDGDTNVDLAGINLDGSADRYRYAPPGAGNPTEKFVVEPLHALTGMSCPLITFIGSGSFDHTPGEDLATLGCPGSMSISTFDSLFVFSGGATPGKTTVVPLAGMTAATSADDNGDGLVDLIALLHTGEVVFRHAPDFQSGPTMDAQTPGSGIAAADFDGDGDADVVVQSGAAVKVYENTGLGLAERQTFTGAPVWTLVRDLDLDGKPDVAWVENGKVEVRRNLGGFVFTAWSETLPSGVPLSFAAGDMEGDGDPELVISLGNPPATATTTQVLVNQVR